jgi:hypothetical protein
VPLQQANSCPLIVTLSILLALKWERVINERFRFGPGGILAALLLACGVLSSWIPVSAVAVENALHNDPVISKLKPEQSEGRGYQLVYTVNAPVEVTWDFKTDFASQVLMTNKLIRSHRLVSRNQDEVVTETVYDNKPAMTFKWQTTLFPEQHLLKFVLLNPEECGQKFHHGYIQLEAVDAGTRVTQVAYFDFFGVSFWVNYPFSGGMSHFLKYTANWEQQAVLNKSRDRSEVPE